MAYFYLYLSCLMKYFFHTIFILLLEFFLFCQVVIKDVIFTFELYFLLFQTHAHIFKLGVSIFSYHCRPLYTNHVCMNA